MALHDGNHYYRHNKQEIDKDAKSPVNPSVNRQIYSIACSILPIKEQSHVGYSNNNNICKDECHIMMFIEEPAPKDVIIHEV